VTRRDYVLIGLLALAFGVIMSVAVAHPGYTDAYYYFNAAERLATGRGLTDDAIFTYLGLPAEGGLPMPSHLYWMPLTSLVAALPMLIAPTLDAAQITFVPPYVALALIAAWVGGYVGGTRRAAWLAGLAMTFSGFFVPYWVTTDNFTLYGLSGSLALLLMGIGRSRGQGRWFAASGACIGLAHLARNDGLLLLPILLIVALWPGERALTWRRGLAGAGAGVLLYALVMLPWFLRNLSLAGAILPVGGVQTAWMREYNDLFNYPPTISLQAFLAWGVPNILGSRWDALLINTQTLIAVEGLIVLTPFMLLALWARRHNPLLTGFWMYALALHAVMTLVFPFPGARGGLFHSAAALMPFWAALGVVGLLDALTWAAKRRRWPRAQAVNVFSAALLVWLVAFSLTMLVSRAAAWNRAGEYYQNFPVDSTETVMLNDPAAYHYFTGGRAVVLPNTPPTRLHTIFARFGVTVLVLDENVPTPLRDLWLRQNVPLFLSHERKDDRFRVYKNTFE
jgi:hypothetical protein